MNSNQFNSESLDLLKKIKEGLEQNGMFRMTNPKVNRTINISVSRMYVSQTHIPKIFYTVSEVQTNIEYDPIFDGQPGARFYNRRFFMMDELSFFMMYSSARARMETDNEEELFTSMPNDHGMTFEQAYERSGGIVYPMHRTAGHQISLKSRAIKDPLELNEGVVVVLKKQKNTLEEFFKAYEEANGAPFSKRNVVGRIAGDCNRHPSTIQVTKHVVQNLITNLYIKVEYKIKERAAPVKKTSSKLPTSIRIEEDMSIAELADVLNMDALELVHQMNKQRGGRHSRTQVLTPEKLVEYLDKFYPKIKLIKKFGLPERRTKTGVSINKVSVNED